MGGGVGVGGEGGNGTPAGQVARRRGRVHPEILGWMWLYQGAHPVLIQNRSKVEKRPTPKLTLESIDFFDRFVNSSL